MPEVIAAAWISSTRRCGEISASMLAEYSTITCGMVSSGAAPCVDGAADFQHVLGEPICRVKRRQSGILALKLATFTAGGRTSYGAVVGDGIVDLGKRLKHASLLDLLRAGALGEAPRPRRREARHRAEGRRRCCRRSSAPEKILCIGVNYGNRNAEYKDGSRAGEISEHVLPHAGLVRRARASRWSARRNRSSSTTRARSRW